MTAQWGADVANGLNAIRPAGQAGTLLTDGPTGTGFAPLPSNRRERRAAGGARPDAFRIRASVESRKEGDATEKRLVVEMLSSDAPMVTWNDFAIAAGGVEADGGLSPAANCNVGLLGWQRIHEGAWEDAEGFVGDIEVWLRLHLTFNPTLDEGYGPAEQSSTGWTLVASAKDDERWTIPSKAGEMGLRELIRYYRVAKVERGAVTCQDLLGGLHFVEMYPEEGGGGGGGGGSGPGGGPSADLSGSAFGLVEAKDAEGSVTGRTVVNCYWNAGGVTHSGGDVGIRLSTGLVYAEFAAGAESFSVGVASGIDALAALQKDPAKYVFPLYLIDGETVVDLRTAPQLQLLETFS